MTNYGGHFEIDLVAIVTRFFSGKNYPFRHLHYLWHWKSLVEKIFAHFYNPIEMFTITSEYQKGEKVKKMLDDAALNISCLIRLNSHLDDAHINLDQLKFVVFCVNTSVQMCRKQINV